MSFQMSKFFLIFFLIFFFVISMFVFVFVYIKKYNLQTEKRKLNCRDYFSHFVILLVLKVCFSLVTQKLMINCTPRNQSNRWNFPTVMIIFEKFQISFNTKKSLKFKLCFICKFRLDRVHGKMLHDTHLKIIWFNYIRDTKQQS